MHLGCIPVIAKRSESSEPEALARDAETLADASGSEILIFIAQKRKCTRVSQEDFTVEFRPYKPDAQAKETAASTSR